MPMGMTGPVTVSLAFRNLDAMTDLSESMEFEL